ncbi:polysaccharide biosynthesis tyrosine autokinase [Pseudonocardia adelaidensis]|uniref:Polysaccharide biosynthesis tyrosine autokinase n=1 Tax=Pseudonocardia adelaidensis TaxID=648754 RepID=A0ABP9NAP7_9PSEU
MVLCLVLGVLGAGVANYFAPREYSSDITLYVSLQGSAEDSDEAYQANELAKERVLSYEPLVTDERITQAVIDRLGLAMTPAELASHITVTVDSDSVVLTAAVRDSTPQGAADIANALAAEVVGLVGQLEQPIGRSTPPAAAPGQPAPPAPEPAKIGAQIIRPATPQPTPVAPDTLFNLALGGALGLLIGVVGLVVREARDRSLRSVAELNEVAPAPLLAEIAHDRQVPSRPLIVDEPFTSPRAEAFRKLRTNLQFRDGDRGHHVVVVTSARMGEGASTTACNLAIAMAEAGNRVLLVDANLRNPRVSDYLGLDPFPGLVDVLAGRMVWQYARQPWNRGGFDVLTAGPYPHNHSQLLASYSLADLFADMRNHYDFVVVDTPALLAVSDAAAVAARADGVVLVVQHRQTSQDQVAAAVEALSTVSARLLGTVLTMTKGRLRREGRAPSYQVPVSTARRDGPLAPPTTPAPPEVVTSPPDGLPRSIPEQAGGDDATRESTVESTTRPVDNPKRPSPTPRR